MRPITLSALCLALLLPLSARALNSASDLRFGSDIDMGADMNSSGVITDSSKSVSDDYTDAVIFSLLSRPDSRTAPAVISPKDAVFDVVAHQKGIDAEAKKAKEAEEAKAKEATGAKRIFRVRGYCQNQSALTVKNIQSYAIMPCRFSNSHIRHGELMLSLNPVIKAQALVGEGIQIVDGDTTYQVKKGVVMNNARTSINISNFYNDIMGEKLLAQGIQSGSQVFLEGARAYLDDVRASKTTSETVFVNGGVGGSSTPVINTNTEAPDVSTYLASATIELASVLGQAFGKALEDDITYLFEIYPNTQLYVDMIVERIDDENDAYTEEEYRKEFESGDDKEKRRPSYPVKQNKGEFFDTKLENETKE